MKKPKLGVLISGRGSNMAAIIKAINNGSLDAEIAVVLSNKVDAPGLDLAKAQQIPTHTYLKADYPSTQAFDAQFAQTLQDYKVDLVILAGFMRLIGDALLQPFENRILNIHPSLLPDFKGLAAQKQALDAGVSEAGCTVHYVTKEMDSGEIILQKKVPVLPNDTVASLSERILEQEHLAFPEAIAKVLNKEGVK